MRRAFLALAMLLSVPFAAGESWQFHAAGGAMYQTWGVVVVQFADHDGVGLRYWNNETTSGGAAMVVVVCYEADSGIVATCDRHWLNV